MVSVPLFFRRFFASIPFAVTKYCGCGYAIDLPVKGVDYRFS
jgi:hypothetical protein